jgi:hypothetical protein
MSQAGIVDFIGTHPELPTTFVTNSGTAIPIANTLEILGTIVSAHSIPLETTGSGNTVTIVAQYASASATSIAAHAGMASFDSVDFTVDANGFVSLTGTPEAAKFTVDASTAPGTNPVVPDFTGNLTITGGQIAAGTTANVIRTDSLAANTYTIQVQRSQAVGVSTVGDNGVAHFNSTYFTVDSNGFVSINGASIGETITGNTGGALSPTAGNWNIFGASIAAGTTPVHTAGSVSTLTVQVQTSQAIASTDATKIGLAAFNSANFTVDANGFVTLLGTGVLETLTGNTGGAISPTAGNINTLGTGSITIAGSGSTLTTQLTGLTNHSVQVGAGTATLTQLTVGTNGQVLIGSTAADPAFATLTSSDGSITFTTGAHSLSLQVTGGTTVGKTITGNSGGALSPTSGNWNILGTGSITTVGSGSTLTVELTGLTNHNVLVGAGTATVTNVAPSATSGVPLISQGASADPAFGTAVVAGGGTGDTSFTAYAVICGGTTSTGALQSIASVGTAGQVLTSNGAGALPTFQAAGANAFSSINVQTFTTTGTYTPTSGMLYCIIECVGGGGGGGASSTTGAATASAGGGGAGGAYSRKFASAATIGVSQTVTIGAAGTAGAADGGNGGSGGVTSVGSICSANGGTGGFGAPAATLSITSGGVGGSPVGGVGDITAKGACGGIGVADGVGNTGSSGIGTISLFGGGAQARNSSMVGSPSNLYGGGGSGALSLNSSSGGNGGAGGAGFVVITEYI